MKRSEINVQVLHYRCVDGGPELSSGRQDGGYIHTIAGGAGTADTADTLLLHVRK